MAPAKYVRTLRGTSGFISNVGAFGVLVAELFMILNMFFYVGDL